MQFSLASHDRNPLHISEEYARSTAFGKPVVFGMLAVLKCLSRAGAKLKSIPDQIDVFFSYPVFQNLEYQIDEKATKDGFSIRLMDGRRTLLRILIRTGEKKTFFLSGCSHVAEIQEPQVHPTSDFSLGRSTSGSWSPQEPAVQDLFKLLSLDKRVELHGFLASLLLTSYLVGMETPGREAMFSQLSLSFLNLPCEGQKIDYATKISGFHDKFNLLSQDLSLEVNNAVLARGKLKAFSRWTDEPQSTGLPTGDDFRGKTALVIGGSRGLGAATVELLVSHGAKVLLNYNKSGSRARELSERLASQSGTVELVQADATQPEIFNELASRVRREYGTLDILVCNAFPALLPLWIEPESVERIIQYLNNGFSMTISPLAAFAEQLETAKGSAVLISSIVVEKPVAEWPHYVAAKAAQEALFQTYALEHPSIQCLLARPTSLMTDFTHTPVGRKNAIRPERVASCIIDELKKTTTLPGSATILRSF